MILKKVGVGIAMVGVVVLFLFGAWFMFFKQGGTPTGIPTATNQNTQIFGNSNSSNTTQTQTIPSNTDTSNPTAKKIFKLADGPIADAVFIQTYTPTTTLARYMMQDSGHILDIPVDVSGAVSRVVSNTTIPGIGSAHWFADGTSVVGQYAENGVIKTVSISVTNTATTSNKIRFLPDNITDLAPSPDSKSLVYLLPMSGGVGGYIAKADGSTPVKLFSSPLMQVLIAWPTNKTLLLQTKEAYGVPGVAFAVSGENGTMTPLVHAQSLSATANQLFSKILYQSAQNGTVRTTYAHDVASGKDLQLPFNPFPEKCVWSPLSTTMVYCAAPLTATPANYLDLWHQGLYNAADSIFQFDITNGITSLTATPGSSQGGVQSNIAALHISPDGKYLLFITKGDRALWGVRLAQ